LILSTINDSRRCSIAKKLQEKKPPKQKSITIKLTREQQKVIKDTFGISLEELNIVQTVHYELGVSVRGWPPAWGGCPEPPVY